MEVQWVRPCSQHRGTDSIPGHGTKIHTPDCKGKKKKKLKQTHINKYCNGSMHNTPWKLREALLTQIIGIDGD